MKAKLLAGVAFAVFTTSGVQAQSIVATDPATPTVAPAAQTDPAGAAPVTDQDIIVTGIRASLASAEAKKRDATSIVDSIVAQDIGKLPDINVAEALQRITGVQITRSRGEGSGITIRGLTQIRTELDGRSVFSGGARNVDLTSIPSELLAGADVYKSISADRIEGGIGGLIDLKLHKPFDFAGLQVAGQVRGTYYDLAGKAKPSFSGLISDRWETGIGDIGILIAGSYQKTAFRSDAVDGGALITARGILDIDKNGSTTDAADAINIQTIRGETLSIGERQRIGFNGSLQWQPSPELLLHLDGAFNDYKSSDFSYANYAQTGAVVDANGLAIPGSFGNDIQVFDGTRNFKSGTFNGGQDNLFSWGGTNQSRIWQAAGGAQYDSGPVHLFGDVSYTKVNATGVYRQVTTHAATSTVSFDLSRPYASFAVGGVDLTNPKNVVIDYVGSYPANDDNGSELAWKVDGTFDIASNFLKSIKFGVRYADRKTAPTSLQGFFVPPTGVTTLADVPQISGLVDFQNGFSPPIFSRGLTGGFSPQQFLSTPIGLLQNNFGVVEAAFGNPPYVPSGFNLSEKTFAGYAMANFDTQLGGIRLSGNGGIRVIRTDTSTVGTLNNPDGSLTPISVVSSYVSALPMFNIKADVTDRLVVRAAASKGLTRPDFGSLSPVLSLSYGFNTGSSGNPALQPIKANQADLSVEYYLSKDSFAYVAGFMKNVDGFLTNVAAFETIPGLAQPFLITRPVNGTSGKIRGFEIGWNQFLTFLPGPLSGLGFQVNYTYVYSAAPSPLAGSTASYPLLGLSKNSYNLVGIYEKGPLSLRVAYNWRDKSFNSIISGSQVAPDYAAPAGYLDASVNVDLTSHVTIFADANNLTRTVSSTYYEDPQRPHYAGVDDRRFSGGVRFRF